MIRIRVVGAGSGVTGSSYLVETPQARVLVDFGQFQGADARQSDNASLGPVDPARLNAVVLTHAHLDHSGRLPLLIRHGYRGPMFASIATVDLTAAVLDDAAGIQEQDAARENRRRERAGLDPIPPLFSRADADAFDRAARPIPFEQWTRVADGVEVRFFEAGHILGSASVEMRIRSAEATRTIVFSGDVGPRGVPILRDPVLPPSCDLAFLESTYGDRDHQTGPDAAEALVRIVRDAYFERQRVLIPAFAIGRTQLLLYHLGEAIADGRLGQVPIYLDSPAGRRATDVYMKHQDLYDAEAKRLIAADGVRRGLSSLRIVESPQESMALNRSWDPCVIIAGSGMCEGGRIVHHLRHNLWRRGTRVVLVGYMARGTLGRRLAENAKEVAIFGDPIAVRAEIHRLDGFSAHAGRSELLEWARPAAAPGARIVLTHGEPEARSSLAEGLRERYGVDVVLPMNGDTIDLS